MQRIFACQYVSNVPLPCVGDKSPAFSGHKVEQTFRRDRRDYSIQVSFDCMFSVIGAIYNRQIVANFGLNSITRKPVGFMQSWNCTSCFKSHLLLIWHFLMRLEMRCAIWNFLKLSDETWNEMCYLKLLKLSETWNISTHHKSYLFETFRWDLKKDVIFKTFETFVKVW